MNDGMNGWERTIHDQKVEMEELRNKIQLARGVIRGIAKLVMLSIFDEVDDREHWRRVIEIIAQHALEHLKDD